TNQVQATFTVDNIFPSFTISSPTNSATLSTSSFTVSGTASDVGTGLASVTWNIDFGSVSTATTSNNFANWSFVTPSLSNGVHTINVNATDKAGNLASQIISVTVHAPTYPANTIYAIGGGTNSGSTNAVDAYNPGTNTWTPVASLPVTKNGLAAATDLSGNIYAIAGNNGTGTTNTVFKYTPGTNSWTSVAPLPFTSYRLAATTSLNGTIYAMGGNNGGTYLNNVAKYNPGTNTWTSVASLPTATEGLRAITDFAGNIYAIGGYTAGGSLNTVEKYNPGTNTWTSVASMSTARAMPVVTIDSSGNIYAMGGQDVSGGGPIYSTVEKYNVTTNTWTSVASMPTGRSAGAGATDSSGNIYAMGGEPALFS